jgi:hypothetical protein
MKNLRRRHPKDLRESTQYIQQICIWCSGNRVVAHMHMGSWKARNFRRKTKSKLARRRAMVWLHAPSDVEKSRLLYPVSVPFNPPFTVMTHLKGQGDRQVST